MSALAFGLCSVVAIQPVGDLANGGGYTVGASGREDVVVSIPLERAMQYHVEVDAVFNRYFGPNVPDVGFQFAARWTGGVAPGLWSVHDRWASHPLDNTDRTPVDVGFEAPANLTWTEDVMLQAFSSLEGYPRSNPGFGFYAPKGVDGAGDTAWLYQGRGSFITLNVAGDLGRLEFVLSADEEAGYVFLLWSPLIRVTKCPYTVDAKFSDGYESR